MGKITRRFKVQIVLEQREEGTYSSQTLVDQTVTLPADLPDKKVATILAGQIAGLRDLADAAHGPIPADVPTVEVTSSF